MTTDERANRPIYCGLFVPRDVLLAAAAEIRRVPLEREIPKPHVTLAYRPRDAHRELLGAAAQIQVLGYGCDANNEGLLVRVSSAEEGVRQLLERIPRPHITLSVSARGKPADTAGLRFAAVTPFFVEASYGIFCADGRILRKPE